VVSFLVEARLRLLYSTGNVIEWISYQSKAAAISLIKAAVTSTLNCMQA
jgi:hypothetical protein